ncbi:hypothetical protein [Allopontixanthobacter sp.]|uniref:hypothetical protein n=1 Tax=Allopontixanthobacter sp. TaxID=2906452 RepID=UPI002AB91422|nr:hypothetical protein [Allopontixanthobacter sp.]MDZ4308550.1 hypothetical protein [Allopontixanthobacter sp.]
MYDSDLNDERDRLVELAMESVARRGGDISKATLATDTQVARAKIDRLFPEEADLAAALVERWFRPLVAIMEDVLAAELPPNRKMYEFFARRFDYLRALFQRDPATFALFVELGDSHWEEVRSYVDLGDHYLSEIIAQAQADGYFPGLTINHALSLINQMLVTYVQPMFLIMIPEKLSEDKLAQIVDTVFAGLSASDRGAAGVSKLRIA